MSEPAVKAAIFDDGFNCVHCDSKTPPDWIQTNKGEKLPHPLALSEEACLFLGREMLLEVWPPARSLSRWVAPALCFRAQLQPFQPHMS